MSECKYDCILRNIPNPRTCPVCGPLGKCHKNISEDDIRKHNEARQKRDTREGTDRKSS